MKYKNSVNEWYNSIYSYNSKKLNIISYDKSKSINILLNSYFNLKKLNKSSIKKLTNIFSLDYIKNLIINSLTFTYNNNNNNIKNIYKNNNLKKLSKWKLKKISYIKWLNKKNNLKTLKSLKRVFISFPYIKYTNNNINILIFVFNKYKLLLLNKIKKLNRIFIKLKRRNIRSNKSNIKLNKNTFNIVNLKYLIVKYITYKKKYNIFKKSYLANLYLNIFKYNNINLVNIKNIIYKIYNKKININIIDMKYLYLDNSNLIQAITRKLNDRKKKVLKTLKKTLKLIKLAKFLNYINKYNNLNVYYLKSLMNTNIKSIYNNIINNLKNKHLIGVFLEAKGRLTRRMTASRAVYKLRYKGNMKNPYSINKSTKLSRGYIKPNVIINKNNSYNKNGSFGITSRVNTY